MKFGFLFAPGTPAKLTVAIGLVQMDPTVLVMTSLSTHVDAVISAVLDAPIPAAHVDVDLVPGHRDVLVARGIHCELCAGRFVVNWLCSGKPIILHLTVVGAGAEGVGAA